MKWSGATGTSRGWGMELQARWTHSSLASLDKEHMCGGSGTIRLEEKIL
jgi:hypothetical protein